MQTDPIIASCVNNGDCPECGEKQGLVVTIIREEGYTYGDVSCRKCFEWITDLMPEELREMGIDVETEDEEK